LQGASNPGSGKSRRQRNSALTWDVPLALDEQPHTADVEESARCKAHDASPSQYLATIAQRTAFDIVSAAYLRKVVCYLLQSASHEVIACVAVLLHKLIEMIILEAFD
jgi:hypothetical protein